MSIAILNDVYTEVRRLSIAGSVVAPGDFRLKKLIEPLRKAGEKAPIFARIADCAEQVIGSTEKTAAASLLELGSIINSVLYTQGTTGIEGSFSPLPPSPMTMQKTQTSARVLKPLLEALSTSGGGRYEQIRSAYELKLFNDLRLVRASIDAIDDTYSEIRDFIAEKILPMYGRAIFDELKAKFDVAGRAGHCNRLKAMHTIAPDLARELVMKALEEGSKEMKVVAVECLGDSDEDLGYLLEQARAKAKDVRAAAMVSLSRMNSKDAQSLLISTLDGKDLELLLSPARTTAPKPLLAAALVRAQSLLTQLPSLKDKKDQKTAVEKLLLLMQIANSKIEKANEQFLISVIEQSDELKKVKSDPGGGDVVELAITQLASSGESAVKFLVANREKIDVGSWNSLIAGARRLLKPADFFKQFSAYVNPNAKKKSIDYDRSEAILREITDYSAMRYYNYGIDHDIEETPLDPKWLDLAIEHDLEELVFTMATVKSKSLHAYLTKKVPSSKTKKSAEDAWKIAMAMVRANHPDAEAVVIEFLDAIKSTNAYWYLWNVWSRVAAKLPASAIPKLEEIVADPKTNSNLSDGLVEAIQEIRSKQTNTK